MYLDRRVAVVMPVHNEDAHVERALERVPAYVDLIVVVDDGSTDQTRRVLSHLADARLTILSHKSNRGVGAATKTGYRYVLDADVELIAVMDGDGQMDGCDLSHLLDCAIERADFVKGNRFLDRVSIRTMPRLRYFGNRFFSWLARRAASYDSGLDAHCGYTVIRKHALRLLELSELYDRYGFPTEMFLAACRAGLVVKSVPVRTLYGDEVSGVNPLTTIPAIFYLIARGCIRRRRSDVKRKTGLNFASKPENAEVHLEA